MKKLSLIVLLFTLSSAGFAGDLRIGLKADPTFSWIKPENNEPLKRTGIRTGFTYGVVTEIAFSDNYSILTGIDFANLGGKLSYNDSIFAKTEDDSLSYVLTNRTYRLKYVVLPLSIKMMTKEIGYFKYYGQFGLELGVRVSARADDINEGLGVYEFDGVQHKDDQYIEKEIALFRAGLVVGFGAEYNISGNTAFLMGIKFNNGFSNQFPKKIDKQPNLIDGLAPVAYSKPITVTLGIMF